MEKDRFLFENMNSEKLKYFSLEPPLRIDSFRTSDSSHEKNAVVRQVDKQL